MRRPSILIAVILSMLALPTATTLATGPGGWGRVGDGGSPGVSSLNAQVSVLNTDKPGTLLVGGTFTNAGGNANADRIAAWNGSTWSALGSTPLGNGSVFAIAYNNGKVYAGGNFVNAGGSAAADYLAVFDGTTWKPFCNATANGAFSGSSLQVTALQVVGPILYVGGTFQNANNVAAADYLIGCNMTTGAMTTTVNSAGGFTGGLYALTADSNGVLYAGGTFLNLDGVADADFIAAYDGTDWHGVGTTRLTGIVRALAASGTTVYVSTDMLNIVGATADHVVKWDGSSYSALGSNTAGDNGWVPSSATIQSLLPFGSQVFASGGFSNANGDATADNLGWFDGSHWTPVGSNGAGDGAWVGEGHSVAVFKGQLYAGGNFTSAGGDSSAHFIASRSLKLPDVSIAGQTGSYVGGNVYSSTATAESKTVSVPRGSSRYARIAVQNDGTAPASFTINGSGASPGYSVTYFDPGNVNVTTAVKAGTFATVTLAPGQTFVLRMVVKLSGSAAANGTFTVTASSTAGTPKDAVKAVIHAT